MTTGTINTVKPVAPTEYMGYLGTHGLSQDGAENPWKRSDFLVNGRMAAWSIWDIIVKATSFVRTDWYRPGHPSHIKMSAVLLRNQPGYVFGEKKQKENIICVH